MALMKVRSFLAFDIPPNVQGVLGNLINDLRTKSSGVKWAEHANLHVTLKFFGDVEEDLLLGDMSRAISEAIKGIQPVIIECSGVGVFPDWRYPRIIWAGFMGDTEPVIDLQKRLEKALEVFPLPKDKRAFRLHLTIGRVKEPKGVGPLVHLVEALGPIKFGEVKIDHLTLYKSQLTKMGSVYTCLKRFELRKGA